MPKLCKRIIALLLAFCLVGSFCFSALAVTSENQATFWQAWLAYLAGMNDNTGIFDGWGGNDFIGNLVSPDTVCPESSDGYHHGSQVDGLVDGRAKVKCSECGQWFYYSASDLENQYTDLLHDNNLDNGLSVTPQGVLIWYPVWSDVEPGNVWFQVQVMRDTTSSRVNMNIDFDSISEPYTLNSVNQPYFDVTYSDDYYLALGYAPYKSEIDSILSGFMYLGYIWLLFKKLPGIIQGAAMATDAQYDIEKHGSDATARAAHYGLIGGDDLPF